MSIDGAAHLVGPRPAAYLAELVARLSRGVGDRLTGAWLLGSAVLGDFDPARSDLDVQALTATRLSERERRDLAVSLSHEALPCPARGLELVLYAREDLDGAHGPAFQLNLNTGRGIDEQLELRPATEEWFWFVIDLQIGRAVGHVLHGPPLRDVIPPAPRRLVLDALLDCVRWQRRDQPDGAATVLAACRAWAWASDGAWRSKREAARWAAGRLADPQPVERAAAWLDGSPRPPPSVEGAAGMLDHVESELALA